MDKRFQGDQGVFSAMLYFATRGYVVSVPTTESSRYDLLVDDGTKISRVQVKTTTFMRNGKYTVEVKTNGGNMSTKNNVKKISSKEIDLLFVLDGAGNGWLFDAEQVDGMGQLTLGSKYKDNFVAVLLPPVVK